MKRLMSILSACALMTLLLAAIVSPAMADDNNHRFFNNNNDDHRFFVNDFNDFNDFVDDNCIGVASGGDCIGVGDDNFFDDDGFFFDGGLDDCDFLGFDGNGEAVFSCDVDFD